MFFRWTRRASGLRSNRFTGRSSARSSGSRGRLRATAHSALEAVQDGFADALRRSGQWAGRGSLEAWVWRCVVNRARKARRRPLLELPTDASRSDGGPEVLEPVGRLAALPERQRLVVFLRYFADLEYREIGAALGIETGTVSATLHAAHAGLRAGYEEALA